MDSLEYSTARQKVFDDVQIYEIKVLAKEEVVSLKKRTTSVLERW